MFKSFILLAIFSFALICNAKQESISISAVVDFDANYNKTGLLAMDGGWSDCSVGQITEISFGACGRAPCSVSGGQNVQLSVRFRPRDNHCCMAMRTIVMKEAQLVEIFDGDIQDSGMSAGQLYDFDYNFNLPSGFSGAAEFRLKMYQNYVHELCFAVPLNFN